MNTNTLLFARVRHLRLMGAPPLFYRLVIGVERICVELDKEIRQCVPCMWPRLRVRVQYAQVCKVHANIRGVWTFKEVAAKKQNLAVKETKEKNIWIQFCFVS